MAESSLRRAMKLHRQPPDPARFSIRYAPREDGVRDRWRSWPGPEAPWIDLSAAEIGSWGREIDAPAPGLAATEQAIARGEVDDLLYLPPVPGSAVGDRDRVAAAALAAGAPVLIQVLPADLAEPSFEPPAGAVLVLDLLALFLPPGGGLEGLPSLPAGCFAVWPLISGLDGGVESWDRGCGALARLGAAGVQPVRPGLTPTDCRRLVERLGEKAFDRVFHQAAPGARDFSRTAARHGLAPFMARPLPPETPAGHRLRLSRRVAGRLALAGELWSRLGRPAGQGQAFFNSAREAERGVYDLEALAREGNLGVLDWLDPLSRRLLEETAAGEPGLLAGLEKAYLEGEPDADPENAVREEEG